MGRKLCIVTPFLARAREMVETELVGEDVIVVLRGGEVAHGEILDVQSLAGSGQFTVSVSRENGKTKNMILDGDRIAAFDREGEFDRVSDVVLDNGGVPSNSPPETGLMDEDDYKVCDQCEDDGCGACNGEECAGAGCAICDP